MNTTQIILQYGGFGVIAIMFVFVFRWLLHTIDTATKQTTETTTAFIETANDFNQTVLNHMVHETEAFNQLTTAIERLCTMWDVNNSKLK